jgi:single-stranded-DNA-specific exonuclease
MTNITHRFPRSGPRDAATIFHDILAARGYQSEADAHTFIHPPTPDLAYVIEESGLSRDTLKGVQAVLDTYLASGDDIAVFGDYDADGVTATAALWLGLLAYAKRVHSHSRILPFVPDRHAHGYGLSSAAVKAVISGTGFADTKYPDFRPRLVITVDNGIVAHAGVSELNAAGIAVVITDHHQPLPTLPEARAILHTTATSGAGVAWILALYLLEDTAFARDLIEYATIGIVADLMPLTGLNRSIVVSGLKALSTTKRPGLLALYESAGLTGKTLSTYDLSFALAPRINAAGRIYNPLDALRLLCTGDREQAHTLAAQIESHNQDRQNLTEAAILDAEKAGATGNITVTIGPYHEGVIGLVAGKLAEKSHHPAIVMSEGEDVVKGSARSIPGFDITAFLRSLTTPFVGLGGHAGAAGFSLQRRDVEAFMTEVETRAKEIPAELLVKSLLVETELTLSEATMSLAEMLKSLEPYGMENPRPLFLIKEVTVLEDRRLGSEGQHRKVTIHQGGTTRELILFRNGLPHPLTKLSRVVATLDINVWRGKTSLQLIGNYVETPTD